MGKQWLIYIELRSPALVDEEGLGRLTRILADDDEMMSATAFTVSLGHTFSIAAKIMVHADNEDSACIRATQLLRKSVQAAGILAGDVVKTGILPDPGS